jgi:hypothetical protein
MASVVQSVFESRRATREAASEPPSEPLVLQMRPCLAVTSVAVLCLTHRDRYAETVLAGGISALALATTACLARDRVCRVSAAWGRVAYVAAALSLAMFALFRDPAGVRWRVPVLTAAAMLFIFSACFRRFRAPGLTAVIAASVAAILGGVSVFPVTLAFAPRSVFLKLLRMASASCLGVVVAGVLARQFSRRQRWWILAAALLAAGGWLRYEAMRASPEPVTDVFVWLRDAPGHLMHGINPYSATYASCYVTERARKYHLFTTAPQPHPMAYPPLPIVIALPIRALGFDVRAANIGCDVLAAFALFAAACRRGNPFMGLCIAAIYLNLPGVPYLVEQSWYEPMLAALLGTGLLLSERASRVGRVLLALGITGKQFGILFLPSLLRGFRRSWRAVLLTTIIVGLALCLPFLIWNPRWFAELVVWRHLQRPTEFDSSTLFGLAHRRFGWEMPRILGWTVACLFVGCISWRTPEKGTGIALWMGTSLLGFLLCNPVAHANYFYLAEYLILLGAAGLAITPEHLALAATFRPPACTVPWQPLQSAPPQ